MALATWGSAHAGLSTSSTIQALPASPFPSMVTPTASSKFTSPFPQQLPLQAQLGFGTLNPQSSAPPPPLPSASSFSNAQLVSLFQQFLEQVNSSSQPAPPSAPQPPSQVLQANTIADLCKHPGLQNQADAIMAALPLLSSSSALKGSLLVISPILLPSNFNNYGPISLSLAWIPPTSNILNWISPNLLPVFLIALDILQLISNPTCPLICLTLWIWPVVFNGQLIELITGEFSRLSNKEPPHGQLISHTSKQGFSFHPKSYPMALLLTLHPDVL